MLPARAGHVKQDTESLLRLMVETVEDYAMFVMDTEGNIQTWNGGGQSCNGYAASEIVGCSHARLYLPAQIADGEPECDLEQARQHGRFRREGWRIRKDASRFWAVVTLTALYNPPGNLVGYASITRDLTDRREQDQALLKAVEQAEAAAKAKSDFIANMSHELRTPLNAILGFSELISTQMYGPLSEKNREYVEHIHDSGGHLLDLINDILDMAKLDAEGVKLSLEQNDLRLVVLDAITTMKPQADRAGISLIAEAGSPVTLSYDRRYMHQVLLNLLSNAIKFTHPGGKVTVSVVEAAETITLSVSDTGIGIAEADLAKAFARFGQIESVLSRNHQGTGLGLPLVKQFVELHGGTVALKSAQGVGTTVEISLPK